MGEYATYNGSSIKIGTCEDCYYLRADQRELIEGYNFDEETLAVFRFRFPFPDEDGIEPGQFDDHDRGEKIPGWRLPADFDDHGAVQFVAGQGQGYNVCLPCPEQFAEGETPPHGLTVHRNGWNGGPRVTQQGYRGGELRTIVSCGACGHCWNLDRARAAEVAECFLNEAERQAFTVWNDDGSRGEGRMAYANSEPTRRRLVEIAERIMAGYRATLPASAATLEP